MKNVLVAILLIYSFPAVAFDFDCEVTAVKKSSVELIGRSGGGLFIKVKTRQEHTPTTVFILMAVVFI